MMTRILCSSALVLGALAPKPATAQAEEEVRVHASLGCLAAAIYHEARSEPEIGQRAVAQVIMNRTRHPNYPKTVCDVVLQGSARRTGCQFTFTCDGSLARRPQAVAWQKALDIAADTLAGRNSAPVGDATHYHTTAIRPYWAPSLTRVATLGSHIFYTGAGSSRRPTVHLGSVPLTVAPERSKVSVVIADSEGASPAAVKVHRGTMPILSE